MKLLYFASLRQQLGKREEIVTKPPEARTVGDLIAWLKSRGEGYAAVFEDLSRVKVALNQTYVNFDTKIADFPIFL